MLFPGSTRITSSLPILTSTPFPSPSPSTSALSDRANQMYPHYQKMTSWMTVPHPNLKWDASSHLQTSPSHHSWSSSLLERTYSFLMPNCAWFVSSHAENSFFPTAMTSCTRGRPRISLVCSSIFRVHQRLSLLRACLVKKEQYQLYTV